MKLYNKQILLSTAITLIAGVVQAGEICSTVSECKRLERQADVRIQQLQEGLSQLGYLLRHKDGTIITGAHQDDAINLCRRRGKRLPTARELAVEGTKYGAELLDLNQVSSGIPEGFYLVAAVNSDGKKDQFFYSTENYNRPEGDLGNYWVWSSSVHPHNDGYAYIFNGNNGKFGHAVGNYRRLDGAVRCASYSSVNR
jgi:hypothetical protein